jgi:signal transduction histidine kinase
MTRDAGASSLQVRDAHSRRTWDVAGNLLSGDDGPRAIVVARDITRLVELQETVGREERMAAMGSLVAGVAHEVRNPLFGISTTLAALAARLGENDAYAKYFAVLKNDVLRLKTLMQDLLDYGRPARLELRPTALPELLGEAVRSCRNVTRTLRVVLDLPESLPELPLDRLRMVQVFQNLIQNGLQHSPPGSAVTLQGGSADHAVWIAVQDQGPGFASEDLPRLFEPFFTRRQAGTGLGLSIAQQIVEQHGGTITARNRPEGGAEVRVNLPLVAA